MNHLRMYARKLNMITFVSVCFCGFIGLGSYVLLREVLFMSTVWALVATVPVLLLMTFVMSSVVTNQSVAALETLWQAIWHVSPNKGDVPAPQLDAIKNGRELLSSMVMQIYDLASQGSKLVAITGNNTAKNNTPAMPVVPTFDGIPVPVFILDKAKNVVLANTAGASYLNKSAADLIGRSSFDVLKLSFTNADTIDSWL